MALIRADRVLETSTSTGTGNFALGGAVAGYRDFDSVCANADTIYYCIEAINGIGNPTGEWEVGLGTFNDTDTLVRTSVLASSNAGAAVNFSAGAKRVFATDPGTVASMRTNLGLVIGTDVQAYNAALAAVAAGTFTANVKPTETILIAVGDETTAITTGTAKVTFRMPYAFTVTAVRASLTTVSSSGTPTVDINEAGTTILSTKLTIDASEKTSTTAATAAVISDASLADDAEITIDIDTAGTGAAGLKVYIIGHRT